MMDTMMPTAATNRREDKTMMMIKKMFFSEVANPFSVTAANSELKVTVALPSLYSPTITESCAKNWC